MGNNKLYAATNKLKVGSFEEDLDLEFSEWL